LLDLDQKKIDIARCKAAAKTRSDGIGVWSDLRSVNLSRREAYQPPDFRRAAAVPLYGSPKVSPPPGEFGP
jgi:hypothetical protein